MIDSTANSTQLTMLANVKRYNHYKMMVHNTVGAGMMSGPEKSEEKKEQSKQSSWDDVMSSVLIICTVCY